LIVSVTARDLLVKESRIVASFDLSQNPRLYLDYFKYLGKTRSNGINFSLYNEKVDFPLYKDFRLTETMRSDNSTFEVRLQHNLSHNMYIAISQQYNNSRIHTPESPDISYKGKNKYWQTYLGFELNSVDRKYFTSTGWLVEAEAGIVYGQSPDFEFSLNGESGNSDTLGLQYNNYVRLFIKADHFFPLGPKLVFTQNATLAYLIIKNPYIGNNFLVGGISKVIRNQVPFAGLDESEVKTGSLVSVQLGMQYQLAKKIFVTGRFNAAVYDFHGNSIEQMTMAHNMLTGYGLTFGYDSAIGPIEMTGMYCDQDGKVRYNVNLGYRF
ncbi:MAG TPA: hypothetical protein PKN21_12460, partial [Bacteroidales bacterium]|nr:hypothetical protein [Bacteroidales bacterium]